MHNHTLHIEGFLSKKRTFCLTYKVATRLTCRSPGKIRKQHGKNILGPQQEIFTW